MSRILDSERYNKNYNDLVLDQIRTLAVKFNIEKIVLFGSRARGDYSNLSDYDFAIFKDGLTNLEQAYFNVEVEEIETLNKIDIIFVTKDLSLELRRNIEKEGVLIYEQAGI